MDSQPFLTSRDVRAAELTAFAERVAGFVASGAVASSATVAEFVEYIRASAGADAPAAERYIRLTESEYGYACNQSRADACGSRYARERIDSADLSNAIDGATQWRDDRSPRIAIVDCDSLPPAVAAAFRFYARSVE